MNNQKNENDNKNKLLIRCGGSPKKSKNCRKPRCETPWLRQPRREYLLPENTQRVISICFYLLELSFIMPKNSHAVVEMRKEKINCETDSYRNSRFNAVKHSGYSMVFLFLNKEERNQIIDRQNRSKSVYMGVIFKSLNDPRNCIENRQNER